MKKKIIAGCIALLILAGCSTQHDETLFIGDSVTYLSINQIKKEVPDAKFVARVGYRSDEILDVMYDEVGGQGYDRYVILIGYNDVLQSNYKTDAAVKIMNTYVDGCAVLFTLPPIPLHEDGVNVWNTVMKQEAPDDVHVSDAWRNAVIENQNLISSKDGVHPNEDGQKVLARLAKRELGRFCKE